MRVVALLSGSLFLLGCSSGTPRLFSLLPGNETGIVFKNTLQENEQANVLNYTYFYNGAGVAIGDINNDGFADILFTGNMVANRLYLNLGNFKFRDITAESGVAQQQGWCTGATMADINHDGKLDIYICRSADTDPQRRKNLLYINDGNLHFTESADKFGLADKGYTTQAAFFDYDRDGDLDMFLINHSLQQYAFGGYDDPSVRKLQRPEFASKLYRNDDGRYTDVSKEAGIISNVLSFGLGLAISDIDNDGWPDVHVSNDFNEQDYLFINNHDGTFTEKLRDCMDESSLYSMGSDIADIDNDGLLDLITLDMLPEDNYYQKMHSGAENFEKFQLLFRQGFYYQYSRNMLHKNNGDGTFSEIGQMAGISNTDWSWSALFTDFNNDGNKDLFITNGYAKDFTNMDFIQYNVDRVVRQRRGEGVTPEVEVLNKMPSVNLPNYIYQNNGRHHFAKKTAEWGIGQSAISSGAAYADLDNDGDMDLVVNNINKEAFVYQNNTERVNTKNHYLRVRLLGNEKNTGGIGARLTLYCGKDKYVQEQWPVRGFQSSVDYVLNFGVGENAVIDSLRIVWPDGLKQQLNEIASDKELTLDWKDADSVVSEMRQLKSLFTTSVAPAFTHKENNFNDFAVQPLLPAYLSRQGPAMASADVNGDGREDFFTGGAQGQAGQIFLQLKDGSFAQRALQNDLLYEDVAAAFFDADGDGDNDLYVASGGYEFQADDTLLNDRLYLNDGSGNFKPATNALPAMIFSKGCVKPADIDRDGDMDLFVGGRVVPGRYPEAPESKILINDGKGHFTDGTMQICTALANIGMVTDAAWADVDGDKIKDLVVVGEWMPIKVFVNRSGTLIDQSTLFIDFPSTGWWNRILVADFDNDGDDDLVIGNTGLNTQFHVRPLQPFTLYYNDFDKNGSIDPILCYYINDTAYPAASRDDLTAQLPMLKKKFLHYSNYANARVRDLFDGDEFKGTQVLYAETMQTVFLQNDSSRRFMRKRLPQEIQYAPVYALHALDINHDGHLDLVAAGNQSWTRIKFGRYRANHGMAFLGNGKNEFTYVPQPQSGLNIREDVRDAIVLNHNQVIFGVNDGALRSYTITSR
jgi:hypothetical protein